jgi:chromosome segregation ATPase
MEILIERKCAAIREIAAVREDRVRAEKATCRAARAVAAKEAELHAFSGKLRELNAADSCIHDLRNQILLAEDRLSERKAAADAAAHEYAMVEREERSVVGAPSHRVSAVKAASAMKTDTTRLRATKNAVGALHKREERIRTEIERVRSRITGSKAHSTSPSAPVRQVDTLVDVQAQHQAHRAAAVARLQAELAAADSGAGPDSKLHVEAGDVGARRARAEVEYAKALRESEAAREQLVALSASSEDLRRQLTAVDREYSAARSDREKTATELASTQQGTLALQASIDAALKKVASASASGVDMEKTWAREEKDLVQAYAAAEKRVKALEAELRRQKGGAASKRSDPPNPVQLDDKASEAAALRAQATSVHQEAARCNQEAAQLEGRNAASQKDEIIAQLRDRVADLNKVCRHLTADNESIRQRIRALERM